MKAPPGHHAIMAQRYSDWAREQVDRAGRTLNSKARNDRLALAEYYSQLAEQELAAAKCLEPAVRPPAATPSAATSTHDLIEPIGASNRIDAQAPIPAHRDRMIQRRVQSGERGQSEAAYALSPSGFFGCVCCCCWTNCASLKASCV